MRFKRTIKKDKATGIFQALNSGRVSLHSITPFSEQLLDYQGNGRILLVNYFSSFVLRKRAVLLATFERAGNRYSEASL